MKIKSLVVKLTSIQKSRDKDSVQKTNFDFKCQIIF